MFGFLGKELLSFGIGMVGSLVTGAVQKHKVGAIPNDMITGNNALMWGGGVGGVTQDPMDGLAAAGGAVVASFLHKGFRKVFGK